MKPARNHHMDQVLHKSIDSRSAFCQTKKQTKSMHRKQTSLHSTRFCLVLEQKRLMEGDFWFWLHKKWNENQKMREGGGEGRKCLQTNPLDFEKPAFASERSTWWAWLVGHYWHVSIKGLFHTERSYIWYVTVVVVYSGQQDLPSKARAR